MYKDKISSFRGLRTKKGARPAWTAPTVERLSAGSAENTPGNTINDGPLETIGS